MIVTIDTENTFDKIQHLYMWKRINEVGVNGYFFNL